MSTSQQSQQIYGAAPARSTSGREGFSQEVNRIGASCEFRDEERRQDNKGNGPLPPELHRSNEEARRYLRDMGMGPAPESHRDLAQEQDTAHGGGIPSGTCVDN